MQKLDFFSTKDEVTKVRILKCEPALIGSVKRATSGFYLSNLILNCNLLQNSKALSSGSLPDKQSNGHLFHKKKLSNWKPGGLLGGMPEIFRRKKSYPFVLKRYKTWGHFFQRLDLWKIGFGFEFDWRNHTSGAGAATCIWISVDLDFQQINSVHRKSSVYQFKTYLLWLA